METSYLKAHPLGNHYPEWIPNLHLTVARIQTHALGEPKASIAQVVLLYHGGSQITILTTM